MRNPRPAPGVRKSTWERDHAKRNADDRIAPLTPEDIYERSVVAAATELGYTVSIPCRVCGHPLTNPKSVARHVGPRCRRRGGGDA